MNSIEGIKGGAGNGFSEWVQANCKENPFAGDRRSALYADYLSMRHAQWEALQGVPDALAKHGGVMTAIEFSRALKARPGVSVVKSVGHFVVRGLVLRSPPVRVTGDGGQPFAVLDVAAIPEGDRF